MHPATYVKELGYALSAPADIVSRMALISATAGFHLANYMKAEVDSDAKPIMLNLRIGESIRCVGIRPRSGDLFILYEVLAFHSYRISDRALAPEGVRTIVDCGANIGLTSLYLASRYPKAHIVAIEPDPRNFALLCANTKVESRIMPLQAAIVGTNRGPVHLTQDKPAWGNKLTSDKGAADHPENTVAVNAITLDEICNRYRFETINLLKMDIEGAEQDVFSAPSFLPKVGFIVIELHEPYGLDHFRNDVSPAGFTVHGPGAFGGVRAVTAVTAKSNETA